VTSSFNLAALLEGGEGGIRGISTVMKVKEIVVGKKHGRGSSMPFPPRHPLLSSTIVLVSKTLQVVQSRGLSPNRKWRGRKRGVQGGGTIKADFGRRFHEGGRARGEGKGGGGRGGGQGEIGEERELSLTLLPKSHTMLLTNRMPAAGALHPPHIP